VKSRFAQSLMDRFGQVKAAMDDIRPEPAVTRPNDLIDNR
jgi:hypothetical protein